jgi:hypothetical protein
VTIRKSDYDDLRNELKLRRRSRKDCFTWKGMTKLVDDARKQYEERWAANDTAARGRMPNCGRLTNSLLRMRAMLSPEDGLHLSWSQR